MRRAIARAALSAADRPAAWRSSARPEERLEAVGLPARFARPYPHHSGAGMLFISHDLSVVRLMADRVA